MGYGTDQRVELGLPIRDTPCDLVIIATPIDVRRRAGSERSSQRARREVQEVGKPDLVDVVYKAFPS